MTTLAGLFIGIGLFCIGLGIEGGLINFGRDNNKR